ncbi:MULTISPECIES: alpha/beta hydrolase [unclassified Enterococcus]|uniref:alpha/beta hydrolase n=1 Tax=unclassified Enterococcus TaxID=2608891 RepID=UPI00155433B7|nr:MULTISPECIES: alpha/beta hydrolase [unclassified Enterococcus]MBS7577934.1 alpha/beta hydrolase [Enterococcus sp. MMGLQ5-2]MBS7585205.1 alpha/beta hydrolase [Enterococcus sp. MMGLQ5-1]NPD13062.1 alpha/beta hydrolase [Enterococcus sp. MMGLQ5-1]NPD37764.1 alpha/beta hydrolase [Enterococcus sp. MMGLQ5-2]
MKKLTKWSITLASAVTLMTIPASLYFFQVAQVRAEKKFINHTPLSKDNPVYPLSQSFLKRNLEKRSIKNDGLELNAWWLPNTSKTNKTVIIAHGFNGSKEDMACYGEIFYQLGYNVLMPDNRGHGSSEGKLIGYGATDKRDYIKWIKQTINKNPDAEITLFGLSMGAATVMMTSGESLPPQVKNIIEDCGYDSVWNELTYQAKEMYNLPKFPLLYEVSAISKMRAGFWYQEASSTAALAKNKLPVLFIHGDNDKFVPTEMVYNNYAATKGPKELWLVKGAKHANSVEVATEAYINRVSQFLEKYH